METAPQKNIVQKRKRTIAFLEGGGGVGEESELMGSGWKDWASSFLCLTGHGNEGHAPKVLDVRFPLLLGEQRKGLEIGCAAQRNDQPSPLLELFDQKRRNMVGGARNHDGIEGSILSPAEIAIPVFYLNLIVPQLLQPLRGHLGQVRADFDGVNGVGELR